LVTDTQKLSAIAPGWGSEFKANAAEAEKVKAQIEEDALETTYEEVDFIREILVGFLFALMMAVVATFLVEIYVVTSHGLHQSCTVKKISSFLFNRDDPSALYI